MESETNSMNIEERLKSLLSHLHTESGVLERIVYKNKNAHRRCPYFQALLKVRRDLKLLLSAGLADILNFMFPIVDGKKAAKEAFNSKRQKKNSSSGKHNYVDRLLGVARMLSQMIEPILYAATQISFLLAKNFFPGFSLAILALLARLRVLVQQILLDVVFVYNKVSSLSSMKHSVKLMKGGIEAFREYQPFNKEVIMLECIWEKDKFVLAERKNDSSIQNQKEDQEPLLSEMPLKYETIQLFSEALASENEQISGENLPMEMQPTISPVNQHDVESAMYGQKLPAEEPLLEAEVSEPDKKKMKLDIDKICESLR